MIDRILGRLLRGRHAGEARLIWNELASSAHESKTLVLRSGAFLHGGSIGLRYAGKGVGDDRSPPLSWDGVPEGAVELVLVMEDPDAPLKHPFVHLIAAGLNPSVRRLSEGALCAGRQDVELTLGLTTFKHPGYSGPRALPGHGPHRYVFQLFALKGPSGLSAGARRKDLPAALQGKVIARARLDGCFERA
jgi:Raf kinase inhibitor-like YbhB/YbcL family protein